MARVYVSIGSNIERRRHIESALRMLTADFGPLVQSRIYECDAVGFESAPFYNLVAGFDTPLPPAEVRNRLRDIEDRNGRERGAGLAARTLDIDMLLYDDRVMDEDGVVLPHTDIDRYAFVLEPLAEIAGARRHPVTGRSFAEMRAEFADAGQVLQVVDWTPAV